MRHFAVSALVVLIAAFLFVTTPASPTAASSLPSDRAHTAALATPKPKRTPTPTATRTLATPAPLGALKTDHVGQLFGVHGRVVDVTSIASGVRLVLDDGTGKMELFVPFSIYNDLRTPSGLNRGAELSATVRIVSNRGVVSLRLEVVTDVTIDKPGSTDDIPVSATDVLGTKYGVGALVAIEGLIFRSETSFEGTRVFVGDEYGSANVWVSRRALRHVPNAERLAVGRHVRVVGRVNWSESEGVWLAPALGFDVKIK
jgi:hypothetical protein